MKNHPDEKLYKKKLNEEFIKNFKTRKKIILQISMKKICKSQSITLTRIFLQDFSYKIRENLRILESSLTCSDDAAKIQGHIASVSS